MTDDLRFDRLARTWLELGPVEAPDDVVQAAFAEVAATPQDRDLRIPWRIRPLARVAAAAAVIAVLAAGVGLIPLAGSRPVPEEGRLDLAGAVGVSQRWWSDDRIALTISGAGLVEGAYWRAATYDVLRGSGWTQSDARTVVRAAGSPLLAGTIDDPGPGPVADAATVTVTTAPDTVGPIVVSPGIPVAVDRPVTLTLLGPAGFLGGIELGDAAGSASYRVTARPAVPGAASTESTAATLRLAGSNYPAAVAERYLQLEPGTLGPNARALRDQIVRGAASAAPFDLARSAETILRSSAFTYDVDVRDVDCGTRSIPECFATSHRGYCLHYATTMAAILRDLGVPTRLVMGFRPGEVAGDVEIVRARDAHAWVEVYFTGTGWVAFDPTGSGRPERVSPLP